ncbi:aldolase/citrate lyase family protein [Haloarcula sp. S1AR25-5A]|uniref:Aldolase/citrate lyase family protein n=1 Tax=Haloarcula terrestris TaxID=2950533 RepID=A0AAE4JHF4_9EURY|nr:aldolase/citrate lyase family protein [Haloarcula terrestris]MDS0222468.1 aldolase/citrate lyase family protein [Haloarcula terrestris]
MSDSERLGTVTADSDPLIGSWASIPHPLTVEMAATAGYDFVVIDAEHTPMSFETMGDMLRGSDGEIETIVRVPDDDATTLKRTLDLAPDGVLIPMVETPAQAERIVECSRYPPEGTRGIGPGRSTDYTMSVGEHLEAGDDSFVRHVQLESQQAVENAADIAAIDGIDGVFVGPLDLSLSMGCFGQWENDALLNAIDSVFSAARAAGVTTGTLATSDAEREQRLDWDVDYLATGIDLMHLASGVTDALEHSRDLVEEQR